MAEITIEPKLRSSEIDITVKAKFYANELNKKHDLRISITCIASLTDKETLHLDVITINPTTTELININKTVRAPNMSFQIKRFETKYELTVHG